MQVHCAPAWLQVREGVVALVPIDPEPAVLGFRHEGRKMKIVTRGLRVRPDILCDACEPYNSAQHEPDHCENDKGDVATGEVFIVFRKSTAATKPAVSAFNNPALGQYMKTLGHI